VSKGTNLRTVRIDKSSSLQTALSVKYCDTFLSKFVGLMFSRELKQDHGILLVEKKESRINTSIHMLFMNYDLTILWLDKDLTIIDKVQAKKWVPFYIPSKPAQYVLELHHSKYPEFEIGEKLIIQDKT